MTVQAGLTAAIRLQRSRRRRALAAYGAAGWPVMAGSWWDGHRYRCGAAGCRTQGLHPTCEAARIGWPRDPGGLTETAGGAGVGPQDSLLLATGSGVDVVELPGWAAAVAAAAVGWGAPVARTPTGRWLLFAATGPVDPGLWTPENGPDELLLHSRDSFVPLPPSRLQHGRVAWRSQPGPAVAELMPVPQLLARVLPVLAAARSGRSPVPKPSLAATLVGPGWRT